MTEPELLEHIWQVDQAYSTNIQFWLTGTFATVITAFIAGERLANRAKLFLATLYTTFSLAFVVRYILAGLHQYPYVKELYLLRPELQEGQGLNLVVGQLTILLFCLGTVGTLYFLLNPSGLYSSDQEPKKSILIQAFFWIVTLLFVFIWLSEASRAWSL